MKLTFIISVHPIQAALVIQTFSLKSVISQYMFMCILLFSFGSCNEIAQGMTLLELWPY